MKENYILRRRLKAFSAFIAEHVCVKMRFRLMMFLALCAVSGAWAQTAQVIIFIPEFNLAVMRANFDDCHTLAMSAVSLLDYAL